MAHGYAYSMITQPPSMIEPSGRFAGSAADLCRVGADEALLELYMMQISHVFSNGTERRAEDSDQHSTSPLASQLERDGEPVTREGNGGR